MKTKQLVQLCSPNHQICNGMFVFQNCHIEYHRILAQILPSTLYNQSWKLLSFELPYYSFQNFDLSLNLLKLFPSWSNGTFSKSKYLYSTLGTCRPIMLVYKILFINLWTWVLQLQSKTSTLISSSCFWIRIWKPCQMFPAKQMTLLYTPNVPLSIWVFAIQHSLINSYFISLWMLLLSLSPTRVFS
jgi:hypothetical protein